LLQDAVDAKNLLGPKSHMIHRKKVYHQFLLSPPRQRQKENSKQEVIEIEMHIYIIRSKTLIMESAFSLKQNF